MNLEKLFEELSEYDQLTCFLYAGGIAMDIYNVDTNTYYKVNDDGTLYRLYPTQNLGLFNKEEILK